MNSKENKKEIKEINIEGAIRIILCLIHSILYQGFALTIAYYYTFTTDYFEIVYEREKKNKDIITEVKNKINEVKTENVLYEKLGKIFLTEIEEILKEVEEEEKLDIVSRIFEGFIIKFNQIIEEIQSSKNLYMNDYNYGIAVDYANLCNIDTSSMLMQMILVAKVEEDNNENDDKE